MTGEDGISYSDYFDAALETVYVKEITAPNGYAINMTVYPVPSGFWISSFAYSP